MKRIINIPAQKYKSHAKHRTTLQNSKEQHHIIHLTTAFYLQINLTQVQINLCQIQINLRQIQINLCQIQINLCQIQINLCQI